VPQGRFKGVKVAAQLDAPDGRLKNPAAGCMNVGGRTGAARIERCCMDKWVRLGWRQGL
jgi:hypothetical protein